MKGSFERVCYDPRRLEALVAYAEAHPISPFTTLPLRRMLTTLTPPEGVLELRRHHRTVFVGVVVDRCENLQDAAVLEPLGVDGRVSLRACVAAAAPIAVDVAETARRKAVRVSLPGITTKTLGITGWNETVGSYVLERAASALPGAPLPDGARWGGLTAADIPEHHRVMRAAFARDPGMMLPDLDTFAAATLAAPVPIRVLRVGGAEAGFVRVLVEPGGIGQIATIGRAPTFRGAGLGPALLSEAARLLLERGVTRFRLGVTADNTAALRLYTAAGFETVETWRTWCTPVGQA